MGPRDRFVTVRLDRAERRAILTAARARGFKTLGEYVRWCCLVAPAGERLEREMRQTLAEMRAIVDRGQAPVVDEEVKG